MLTFWGGSDWNSADVVFIEARGSGPGPAWAQGPRSPGKLKRAYEGY